MNTDNEHYFGKFCRWLPTVEGGWANDPTDRGGATNMGVTIGTFQRLGPALGFKDTSIQALKELTHLTIKPFYKHYWQASGAAQINDPNSLLLGDTYWLAGYWGIHILQHIADKAKDIKIDGKFGPLTLGAYKAYVSQYGVQHFGEAYIKRRIEFHTSDVNLHPEQAKFLNGWLNRCAQLKRLWLSSF